MPTKVRVYPYPVLSELDDFEHPLSDDAALYYDESDRDNYIFQIDLKINNEDILKRIKDNEASFFVQVDCPTTSTRLCWRFQDPTFQITIPRTEVLNKVEIACSVIANCDIAGYCCSDFNSVYYSGKKFDLEEGDTMVIFRTYTFDTRIKKKEDANLGDYIEFRKAKVDKVSFDLDEIIYITMPEKLYEKYQSMKALLDINSAVVHSSFVMAALMEGLSKIGSHPGKVWAKSITAKLLSEPVTYKEGSDYILEDDGSISLIPNPIEIASMILQDPYARMLEHMNNYQSSEQSNG